MLITLETLEKTTHSQSELIIKHISFPVVLLPKCLTILAEAEVEEDFVSITWGLPLVLVGWSERHLKEYSISFHIVPLYEAN